MSAGGYYTVRAFDSAYSGSMFERKDGYYVERNDHKSMAAALVELIAVRDRELEDLRDAVRMYQRMLAAAPYLVEALKVFVEKYDATPEGELGIGLTNGDFSRAREALVKAGEAP